MGFLDNKGLKKVVNWVKDYVKNNSLAEGDLQNKQDIWDFNYSSYIAPYNINMLETMGFTIVFDAMLDYGGSIIPDSTKEYKIRGTGQYLKNTFFPSTFDMPWPNNEIPEWEDDHEYEIYIAGGRVVSVDDITLPVEEVSYTITTKDQGYCFINVVGNVPRLDYYIDGQFVKRGNFYMESIHDNSLTFTYTVKGDLSTIDYINVQNLQYVKVDCSKMKSNDLHKVLGSLKVDEIIYPQACVGDINSPIYEFESPEVNLRCLKNNTLYEPTFNFKTDNFEGIFFDEICFNTITNLFGENMSNINANKILRTINLSLGAYVSFSQINLKSLKTVGTLNTSINVHEDTYKYFKFCNFDFINDYSSHPSLTIEADEIVFNVESDRLTTLCIRGGVEPKKVFIENVENVENLDCAIMCEFDVPCTIYYVYGDPSEIHIIGRGENLVSFIKVNSIDEVPFQYAPNGWSDVKNYDDDGNVID